MVTSIREILKRTARAWGLQPAAHLALARQMWPEVVGPELAKLSAPVTVRGKALLIGVTHPVAGQEIRLRQARILAALTREIGEGELTKVLVVARRRLPGPRGGAPATDRRQTTKRPASRRVK